MLNNYCTFYNNTVKLEICIYLYGNSGIISKSYIIFNNSPNDEVVTVWVGNHFLKECIFDQNQDI